MLDPQLELQDWGELDYNISLQRQLDVLAQVAGSAKANQLILCRHPEVVTLGKSTQPSDFENWGGKTVSVQRGGRATYHGPNQLMVYLIVNLTYSYSHLRSRDIVQFLDVLGHGLRSSLLPYCGELSLLPEGVGQTGSDGAYRGLWSGRQKMVSFGIAVKKWVTYHGAAINIYQDPQAFRGIKPCGFSPEVMTSLQAEMGERFTAFDLTKFKQQVFENFKSLLVPAD